MVSRYCPVHQDLLTDTELTNDKTWQALFGLCIADAVESFIIFCDSIRLRIIAKPAKSAAMKGMIDSGVQNDAAAPALLEYLGLVTQLGRSKCLKPCTIGCRNWGPQMKLPF